MSSDPSIESEEDALLRNLGRFVDLSRMQSKLRNDLLGIPMQRDAEALCGKELVFRFGKRATAIGIRHHGDSLPGADIRASLYRHSATIAWLFLSWFAAHWSAMPPTQIDWAAAPARIRAPAA
jgi:hypothetical protein